MEFWTLIEKIRSALRLSEPVAAWCMINYGQRHTLFIEYDEENPPDPATQYPVLVIMPSEEEQSLEVQYGDFFVDIGYGIEESGKSTVDNVITYDGVKKLFEYQVKVETVLFAAATDLGGSWIVSKASVLDINYPFFKMTVRCQFKNPDRMDPIV